MSEEIKNTVKPEKATQTEPLGAVIASGVTLSGQTIFSQPWFNVWLPQTFAGAVTNANGGSATVTITGNGWQGQNNTGYVFQNDQYNTTVRGF